MSKLTPFIFIGAGFALLLLTQNAMAASQLSSVFAITDWLIPDFEGFLAHPKWDNKQYSWGYGTAAPGPDGTITHDQALAAMRSHLQRDYATLRSLITRELSPQQWAAYLSFSYNEGTANADNLVNDINSGNDATLETHWKKYIYADHVISSDLIDRRNREWELWIS